MKRFSHWTLSYFMDRAAVMFYEWRHADWPWLTRGANEFLASWLKTDCKGLEWGAGRSTLWFARRVAHLTSIEHNPGWHNKVREMMSDTHLRNVDLILAQENSPDYVGSAEAFTDGTLDFVLVDGLSNQRAACALAVLKALCPGGILVIDDIQRYLPSNSRSPEALPHNATLSSEWCQFKTATAEWDIHWFSSGVKDTAIWVRPD